MIDRAGIHGVPASSGNAGGMRMKAAYAARAGRGPGRALVLVAVLLVAGCASMKPVALPENASGQPLQVPVAFFPQERYQCGPAALAMALDATGAPVTPRDLVSQVYTPERQGSLQPAMISAARRHGRVAYPIQGLEALTAELEAGRPVVVLQNLGFGWFPQWHYAVAIGFEPEKKEVVLHSGTTPHKRTSLRTFMNTWRRADTWGLVVVLPDTLPASADADGWVSAVSGMESAQQPDKAASGYMTGLSRWPDHVPSWFGLGNALYAMGRTDRARLAWQQAVAIDPDYALAWNNLAQVLADDGRREEALRAAKRALELGGPYKEEFEKTMSEIKERQ